MHQTPGKHSLGVISKQTQDRKRRSSWWRSKAWYLAYKESGPSTSAGWPCNQGKPLTFSGTCAVGALD